jgi:hypothetical protein
MAEKIAELERELAERPSRQELNSKDNKLQATRLRLRKAQDDIKTKDIQLLVRPTELEHYNVKEA